MYQKDKKQVTLKGRCRKKKEWLLLSIYKWSSILFHFYLTPEIIRIWSQIVFRSSLPSAGAQDSQLALKLTLLLLEHEDVALVAVELLIFSHQLVVLVLLPLELLNLLRQQLFAALDYLVQFVTFSLEFILG